MRSLSAQPEPPKTMEKPHFSCFCATDPHGNNTRFKLSPFLQTRTLLCGCGHCLCGCAVCAIYTCACVRICACVCWKPTFQLYSFSLLCLLLLYHVCITPSLKPLNSTVYTLWQPRYNSSRTSSSSLVTATDGASVCVYVPCFMPTK